jgi:hypothetical protein
MSWARPVAVTLAVLTALTCTAPAFAGERAPSASPSTSLAARAAVRVAKLQPTRLALAQEPAAATTTTESPRSFFRSPAGVAAIVLMVAGAGYVAYSIPKDNEKVHSPIR